MDGYDDYILDSGGVRLYLCDSCADSLGISKDTPDGVGTCFREGCTIEATWETYEPIQNQTEEQEEVLTSKGDPIIVGATYLFKEFSDQPAVERKILAVDDKTVTYQRLTGEAKCQIGTFHRLFNKFGAGIIQGEVAKA